MWQKARQNGDCSPIESADWRISIKAAVDGPKGAIDWNNEMNYVKLSLTTGIDTFIRRRMDSLRPSSASESTAQRKPPIGSYVGVKERGGEKKKSLR